MEDHGGTVYYEYELKQHPVFGWSSPQTVTDAEPTKWTGIPVTWETWRDYEWNVVAVELQYTTISDLAPLAGVPHLKSLRCISSSALKDISALSQLPELEHLQLSATRITNVEPLAGLRELTVVYLDSTDVADLRPLSELTRLRELNLDSTDVADLTPLSNLSSLELLDLDYTEIQDLTPLARLPRLSVLSLRAVKVDDASVVRVAVPRLGR